MKHALRRSVMTGVALLAAVLSHAQPANTEPGPLYLQNRNYHLQLGLFDLYKTERADVVMLGNSLTHGVNWNELLNRQGIVNRGIISDVTEGYLHRLEYVYRLRPRLCFVEGGVNDIYADVPVGTVFENYKGIIAALRAHNIIPIIQSALLVSPKWKRSKEKNPEIVHLNGLLADYASRNKLTFVDLNAVMSDGNILRNELTYDGVHLNAAGYALWGAEVERVLLSHGL